ncbi:MAG: hypothetical protein U0746_20490 [Gemmataceae bacterium]
MRPIPRIAAAALMLAALTTPLRAQNASLRVEMEEMAKEVSQILQSLPTPVGAIRVGDFTGPATMETSGGSVIALALTESLPKHGIRIAHTAPVGIKGEYEDVKDKDSGLLAAQISATVVDRSGKKLFECTKRGAFGESLVSSVFGVSAKLPPTASAKERGEILEKKLEKPSCHIAGNEVCCDVRSAYAVEVHVAPYSGAPYVPRPAKIEDGLAFVPLKRGEVFGVKLVNKSQYDAAASLTLDALNMYAFSNVRDGKGRPKYSQVILDAGKSAFIRGWHITNEKSDEFTITEFAKSAAFQLKSSAKTGTIQVAFAAAWPKGGQRPPDEPANPNEHSRSAGSDAVGRGQRFTQKFQEVQYDVGVVRETVSVRYSK